MLIKEKLNPVILKVIEENDIGDNVALFYFASLIKETVRRMNDKDLEESIIRFILDSDCDWLACTGTYVQEDSVINGVKEDGEKMVFYFKQGVLSTIKNIPTIGNVEMRFQKLEENIQ